ncbi:MAG: 16S rRNA processing protein RimM [Erysipelotrichales bacterium]|nr:16S rRNA processing protein RimM [Erysipelotrichales bacterium]
MSKIRFARIINTHGIKGECKVVLLDDFGKEIFRPGVKLLAQPSMKPLTVVSTRTHKGTELVTFKELPSLTEAEKLKGQYLEIDVEDLCDKADGSYYNFELVGLQAVDQDHNVLGVVKAIESTLANDVIRIEAEGRSDILVPLVDAFVLDIDLEENTMMIQVIEGLL